MDLRNPPTAAQLTYFLGALERQPTWKEAARAAGVTPSAFSQGIAELERRLGVQLFERSGRVREPTAEAIAAAEFARRVLAALEDLERWAEETREGVTGELRVGMIDTAAVWHFGDALAAFRERNPKVGLRLTVLPSGRLSDQLRTGELDVTVGIADDVHDDRVSSRPLVVEPIYVYAPPGAPSTDRSSWGPWVSFPADSRTRALIVRTLRRGGVDFDVVAESSQPAVLREMVYLGMGWGALSAVDAEREPHALRRAHPEPIVERVLSLSRRVDRTMSPALRRLVDALVVAAGATDGASR